MRRSSKAAGLTLTILAMAVAVAGGCGSEGSDRIATAAPQRLGVAEDVLQDVGLQYYWHGVQKATLLGNERIQRVLLIDDVLYLVTDTSTLVAIDAAKGIEKWRVRVSLAGHRIYDPTHQTLQLREELWHDTVNPAPDPSAFPAKKTTVINDLVHMLVIDRDSGKILRDIEFTKGAATQGGVCDNRRFYIPGIPRMLYSYDLMIGKAIWWEPYDGVANVPIRFFQNRVYVGTSAGTMNCFAIGSTGTRRWTVDYDSAIHTPFQVGPRGLFFSTGRQIRGLEPIHGMMLWEPVHVNGEIEVPLQLSDTTLYQYVTGDALYAVNLVTGEVRWTLESGRQVLAVMSGKAYILDAKKTLNIVNEITGDVEASVSMSGFDFFASNTQVPGIYAVSQQGQVYCIRPLEAGRLTAEMLQSN